MTDISNLKPGDALTYKQAMALPDGAVVSATWNNEGLRVRYTTGGNDVDGVPRKFEGSTLDNEEYWGDHRWHSVRLESLPELPVWVITCDRCGTTYKNNEGHACAAREPAKPERQASEIEKQAAIDSIELRVGRIIDFTHDNYVRAGDSKKLVELCHSLIAAHDYAKSIGAIE